MLTSQEGAAASGAKKSDGSSFQAVLRQSALNFVRVFHGTRSRYKKKKCEINCIVLLELLTNTGDGRGAGGSEVRDIFPNEILV
ncbi:unnamed protein product [Amoebophrya sp. A25]|nr:unnamed protein product [Amoebophrya sp. A25]|eukprot:GSA25T00008507001.1